MSRLLIIPAAGRGSRLGAHLPKVLVPVAGVPMLDRLLALYRPAVDTVLVVVNPACASDVERHISGRADARHIELAIQPAATGMLDAILLGTPAVERHAPSTIWVTWCDQVAAHPNTIARLASATSTDPPVALVMPTVTRTNPYTHFERDRFERIVAVRHRREGDAMPAVGESDMGLFALSPSAFLELLPQYSRDIHAGAATGERNFLPFVPWLAARARVSSFPCYDPMEAIGVNTPEDLKLVEDYLSG